MDSRLAHLLGWWSPQWTLLDQEPPRCRRPGRPFRLQHEQIREQIGELSWHLLMKPKKNMFDNSFQALLPRVWQKPFERFWHACRRGDAFALKRRRIDSLQPHATHPCLRSPRHQAKSAFDSDQCIRNSFGVKRSAAFLQVMWAQTNGLPMGSTKNIQGMLCRPPFHFQNVTSISKLFHCIEHRHSEKHPCWNGDAVLQSAAKAKPVLRSGSILGQYQHQAESLPLSMPLVLVIFGSMLSQHPPYMCENRNLQASANGLRQTFTAWIES